MLENATDKACTATLGNTTRAVFERMSCPPELTLGLQTRTRLCVWDSGVPFFKNSALIGAIGVLGAAGHQYVDCVDVASESIGQSN